MNEMHLHGALSVFYARSEGLAAEEIAPFGGCCVYGQFFSQNSKWWCFPAAGTAN